jgi:hypothetical protein
MLGRRLIRAGAVVRDQGWPWWRARVTARGLPHAATYWPSIGCQESYHLRVRSPRRGWQALEEPILLPAPNRRGVSAADAGPAPAT